MTKDILKSIARELSKYILKIPIDEDIELIEKEFTRVEKREADLLFKSGQDIIHIEIQNSNHKDMHKRMLRYYSDIYFDFDEYNIVQFVIYIGKYNCTMLSKIEKDKINYEYTIIDMKHIPCRDFLDSNDPSAITLAILCDFEEEDKQLIVNTILKRLKESCQDEIEFRSHLKIVEVLSTNRNLQNNVKQGEEMLTVDIEKMPSFNIGLERGIQQGVQKGKLEGKLEGIIETAIKMVKEFNIPVDEVVKKLNIKKEELTKRL